MPRQPRLAGSRGAARFIAGFAFLAALARRRRSESAQPRPHALRQRLLELVGRRPGLRFKALWRTLQANRGTARYHLHILEKTGVVRAVHDAGSTRFFPAGTDPARLSLMAVLLRGRVLEVAQAVRANPGIRQRDLTDKLPISRKVFRTYADLMVAAGLVEETHEPHQRRYFPTPQLDELLHALEAGPDAEPSEPQGPATGAEGFS